MLWDFQSKTQELRIEAEVIYVPKSEATVVVDSNNNSFFAKYEPVYAQTLQMELVPDYLVEILNIAIGHDSFLINNLQYSADGGFEGERQGRSQVYIPNVELKVYDYQNYASDPEITGDLPVIPETSLAFDSTTSLAFDSTTSLKFT
jgi:hypothetical protein